MADPRITNTFAGDGNHGLQVGNNAGAIHIAAPERPETPPRPSCFVPFRRDPDFVDRGTLLDEVRQRCSAPASRVALVGLGGVGKSQLAIEYCHRTAERSPETWVFWVHASNKARLEQSFREIADQVKVRGRKNAQADVFKLVHDWLRDERNGRWLLVVDNADDAAVLSPSDDGGDGSALKQHLSRYLPPSRYGTVLVTSRTKRAAMQVVEDSDLIAIEPMHAVTAHALLRRKLRGVGEKDHRIAELAAALDHMPFALVQAAAYIRERAPRCTVRQYLEQYRQSDSSATSLLNQEAGHLRRDGTASNAVILTWQISFDHIRKTRPSAADLLSLMSFFDRQAIQETLLRRRSRRRSGKVREPSLGASDDDAFEKDVQVLRDYSFIKVTKAANTFQMHSLMQLATRTWLEHEGQLDKWRAQFISNLCAELPDGDFRNWKKCQTLFPHAQAALSQRPSTRKSLLKWALLLYNAAWYAWEMGRFAEAEQIAIMSMEVRSDVLGEDNRHTLASMSMVGLVWRAEGKYEKAEVIHRQTLALREEVLGHNHQGTLVSMNSLAAVLSDQRKYGEAEFIHKKTLALREKLLGHNHPSTLISMNNLASLLVDQGKCEEAEAIYRHTIARQEEVLGRDHIETLEAVWNFAALLSDQCCYDEANLLFERAYTGFRDVCGNDHPKTLECQEGYVYNVRKSKERANTEHNRKGSTKGARRRTGSTNQFVQKKDHRNVHYRGNDSTKSARRSTDSIEGVFGSDDDRDAKHKSKQSRLRRTLAKMGIGDSM